MVESQWGILYFPALAPHPLFYFATYYAKREEMCNVVVVHMMGEVEKVRNTLISKTSMLSYKLCYLWGFKVNKVL